MKLDSEVAAHYRRVIFEGEHDMRPRFLGTRHHTRIVGGSGSTQRFRSAKSRARTGGKDIVRVDLGGLVSKYVGQTERNIRRLLDEAERANAVLFLDEADQLFDRNGADERMSAANDYLRNTARRRRLTLVMGKQGRTRPQQAASSENTADD